MNIFWFDIMGVFAFAFLGARFAIHQKFNTFGVLTCALLTAFGGGTIRELLLNRLPFYFHNYIYLSIVLAGALGAIVLHQHFRRIKPVIAMLDAVGTVAFAYIGVSVADAAGLGIFGMVCFAILTACGGGLLCDVLAGKVPSIFQDSRLTVSPVALATLYWMFGDAVSSGTGSGLLLGGVFCVQLIMTNINAATFRPAGLRMLRVARRYWTRKVIRPVALADGPRLKRMWF